MVDPHRTQSTVSESLVVSPTLEPNASCSPGMGIPLSPPSLLQATDVFDWLNWQESQKELAMISWAPKSLQMVTAAVKLKNACSLEEKL